MEPEEKTRFDRQVEAEHQKLIAIGREHLQLQALPIGLPDAVPVRKFRKKKTHGLADARGLTGTEIAALDLKKREALARNRAVITLSRLSSCGTTTTRLCCWKRRRGLLVSPRVGLQLVWLFVLALNSPGVCLPVVPSPGYPPRTLPFPRHQQPHPG
jgi:hypothetical protein